MGDVAEAPATTDRPEAPAQRPRPLPRPVPMRHRGRRSRLTRLRGGSVRDSARRYAPLAVVGVVVVGALALIAALVVAATRGSSAQDQRLAGGAQGTGSVGTGSVGTGSVGTGSAASGLGGNGVLSAPVGYVPPTSDTRVQDHVQAAHSTRKAPTEALPVYHVLPGANTKPVPGGWTPAIGVDIANRALKWLNWPYSWDAGNAEGPTYGRAVDHDSRNDGSVRGFDCSGLVLYALAPWKSLAHSAAAQYLSAGIVHPTFAQLEPGDLIFWSANGTVAGVSHVAIYIGNGLVVQAPQSGDVIRVTPINEVDTGTIGTTRPLTA